MQKKFEIMTNKVQLKVSFTNRLHLSCRL